VIQELFKHRSSIVERRVARFVDIQLLLQFGDRAKRQTKN
jgi:hypothetical protein